MDLIKFILLLLGVAIFAPLTIMGGLAAALGTWKAFELSSMFERWLKK